MSDNGMKDRETNCLDVNTNYYGYNIVILGIISDYVSVIKENRQHLKSETFFLL